MKSKYWWRKGGDTSSSSTIKWPLKASVDIGLPATISATSGATASSAITVTINSPLVEIMFVDGLRPAFARTTLPQDYLEKREDPNAPQSIPTWSFLTSLSTLTSPLIHNQLVFPPIPSTYNWGIVKC
jgi:hypothetical protein